MNIDKYLKNERYLKGIGISQGIVKGKAYIFFKSESIDYATKINYEDIENEVSRLFIALDKAKKKLLSMRDKIGEKIDPDSLKIFDAHYAVLSDPLFISEITDNIKSKRVNTEYSVKVTALDWKYKLSKINDPYLLERVNDIDEIANLIIEELSTAVSEQNVIKEERIIISEFITLSELAQIDKTKLLGFVTAGGGYTSHAAIVARSLGIPAVGHITNCHNEIKNNDDLIIDGIRGICIINPSPKIVKLYEQEAETYRKKLSILESYIEMPNRSKDKQPFFLEANLEIIEELPLVKKYAATGIGLFRTEFLLDYSQSFPNEKKQHSAYSKIMSVCDKCGITIRTFDVGGDKMINKIEEIAENNPFLGWRAIRFQLSNMEYLRPQLRAILKANKHGNLRILFPMVTNVDEIVILREKLREIEEELKSEGTALKPYKIGIMIEIPSAALTADKFVDYVDFFSVGTNDLIQYTLAVDRGNEKVQYLYDAFDPSIIRLLKYITVLLKDSKRELAVCGEMAGKPREAILLLILGYRHFSMVPWKIPVIKKLFSTIEFGPIAAHYEKIKKINSPEEVKEYIERKFKDNLDSIRDFMY